ncbi:MAG: Hsp20/alpha crystallin family protein [Chloroflexi bacterium]|nr:Hsp20/alpha crystallin family protein [Chloroflexota bacterium]
MSISRWDPFRDLPSMREAMNRLFDEGLFRPWGWAYDFGSLAVDVYDNKDSIVIRASVPGMKSEDIDISITGDTITISGEVKQEEKVEKENYYRRERRYGSFSRAVALPVAVQSDKAEAVFEDGVLTLTLPKAEEAKPKSIKVTVK